MLCWEKGKGTSMGGGGGRGCFAGKRVYGHQWGIGCRDISGGGGGRGCFAGKRVKGHQWGGGG